MMRNVISSSMSRAGHLYTVYRIWGFMQDLYTRPAVHKSPYAIVVSGHFAGYDIAIHYSNIFTKFMKHKQLFNNYLELLNNYVI